MGIWTLADILTSIPYGLLFGIFLIASVICIKRDPSSFHFLEKRPFQLIVCIFAGLFITAYFLYTTAYLFIPGYFTHIEPTVAVVSALFLAGEPVYPSWHDGGNLRGMIYGPFLYMIHGAFLLFSPTIAATKIAGFLALWGTIILISIEAKKRTNSLTISLITAGCVSVLFLTYAHEVFWSRPDPFLLLLSAAAVLAIRLPQNRAALAIGLVCGLAMSLKLHAALYFAPMALVVVLRDKRPLAMIRIAATIGLLAAIIVAAPFFHPNIDVYSYANYLNLTANHKLEMALFWKNFRILLIILSPVLVLSILGGRKVVLDQIYYLTSLLFCMLVVAVIGSKAGAGSHHMLPFLMPALSIALQMATSLDRNDIPSLRFRARACGFFLIYLIGFAPATIGAPLEMYRLVASSERHHALLDELDVIYDAYPAAEMGVSDNARYPQTWVRVLGVLQGAPVHLDPGFFMDLQAVNEGVERAEELVANCEISEVILPREGQPFSMPNLYLFQGETPLFSDRFRQSFQENYRIVFRGEFYDVWSCSGNTEAAPAKP